MQPKGKKIKCFQNMENRKSTCETKLSCFAYVTMQNRYGVNYGCVANSVSHIFMCNAKPAARFTGKCCNENMCNQRLNLTLPNPGTGEEKPSKFNSLTSF